MRKIVLLIILAVPLTAFSQFWEFGGFLGGSNYNGEFTERLMKVDQTHFSYGGIVRLNLSRHITIKGNIYKGMISGNDTEARKYYHRRWSRNLSFRSEILDIGIQPEWNILGYRTNHFTYKSSPYIFAGISMFKFNPQAFYNEKWISLQPLGTEGQNFKGYEDRRYKLTQLSIPIGFGWKYSLGRNYNIGFEASARKTFTDYLDDCSTYYVDLKYFRNPIAQALSNRTGEVNKEIVAKRPDLDPRGSPEADDWYYFVGFTFTYSLLPGGCIGF